MYCNNKALKGWLLSIYLRNNIFFSEGLIVSRYARLPNIDIKNMFSHFIKCTMATFGNMSLYLLKKGLLSIGPYFLLVYVAPFYRLMELNVCISHKFM